MDGNFGSSSNSQQGREPPMATTTAPSIKSHKQGGSTAGSDVEDEDSEDSESSSSSVSAVLEHFREEWRAELKNHDQTKNKNVNAMKPRKSSPKRKVDRAIPALQDKTVSSTSSVTASDAGAVDKDLEDVAKQHFLMGIALERQGDLYEAVRCYRRAIQMVPDIEFRVSLTEAMSPGNLNGMDSTNDSDNDCDDRDFDSAGSDQDESEPLEKRILRAIEAEGWQYFQKRRPDNKPHLNDIPSEIITYILRWVITNELDVRSLDVLSGVSRGFYCLCRDEQLWKMTCEKVWSSVNLIGSEFSSYREMFLTRTRVRLDGCYISRVTYVRPGEHSFQDQSYRAWHFVEYYRYIRFFPDGELYFLTTSDPPALAISTLKERPPRNSVVMKGRYKLLGDTENTVHCTAVKTQTYVVTPTRHGRKNQEVTDTTQFHMYFQVQPLKDRFNWVLKWTYYAVYASTSKGNNNGNGELALYDDFNITPTKFPPLYYSRVKSFTGRSESLLE